jgi:hypothetical protein
MSVLLGNVFLQNLSEQVKKMKRDVIKMKNHPRGEKGRENKECES